MAERIRVPRPAASTTATVLVDDVGLGGFTKGVAPSGDGQGAVVVPDPIRVRRDGVSSHQWVGAS